MYKVLAHSSVEERDIVVFEALKPSLDVFKKGVSIMQGGAPLIKGDLAVIRSELSSILSGYLKHQVWGQMKTILDESGVPLNHALISDISKEQGVDVSIRESGDLKAEQMQSVSKLILVYQEMVNISQEIAEVLSRGIILARGVEELSSVEEFAGRVKEAGYSLPFVLNLVLSGVDEETSSQIRQSLQKYVGKFTFNATHHPNDSRGRNFYGLRQRLMAAIFGRNLNPDTDFQKIRSRYDTDDTGLEFYAPLSFSSSFVPGLPDESSILYVLEKFVETPLDELRKTRVLPKDKMGSYMAESEGTSSWTESLRVAERTLNVELDAFFGDEVETGRQRLFQDQEPLITEFNKRLKVKLKRSNVCLKMEWWRLDADGNPKMDHRVPDAITIDHSMSNANAYIPILKDLRDTFKAQIIRDAKRVSVAEASILSHFKRLITNLEKVIRLGGSQNAQYPNQSFSRNLSELRSAVLEFALTQISDEKLSLVKPWLEELIEFSDFAYLHKLCSGTVMRQDGRILRDVVEQLLPQFQQYEGAGIDLQKLDDLLHDADMMVTLSTGMKISARENPYEYLDDLVAQWERKFEALTRTHVSDEDQKSYAFLSVEGQLNTLKILRSVLDDSNKRGLDRLILSNFGITGETDAEGGAKEVMSALFFLTLLDLRHKPDMPMGIPLCLLGEARETVLTGLVSSLKQLYGLGKDSVFMQRQNGVVTLLQGPSDLSKENGTFAARVFINQAAIEGTREMLTQVPGSNPKVTMAVGASRGRAVADGISGSGTAAFAMQYVGAVVKQSVGLTPSEQLRDQLFQAIRSRKVPKEGSYHPLPSSATVQGEQIRSKMATPETTGQFVSSIQGARLAAAAMPQHERHAEISALLMDAALRSSAAHHAFMQGRYMRKWQVRNGQSDAHLTVSEWPQSKELIPVLATHAPHEVAMQQLVSLLPDEVYSRLFHESFNKDLGYVSNDGLSICESLFGITMDVSLQEAIRSAVLRTASEMKGAEDTLRMANIQKVYAEDASTRPGARPPEPSRDGMPSKYDGRAIGENASGARSGLERTTWVGMAAASDCLSTSELSDVLIQGAYQGAVLVQEQLAIAVKGLWNFDEGTLRQALDILPESPQKELVSALAEAYIEQYNLTVAKICTLLEKESLKDALESLDPVYYQRSVAQREEILAARLLLYRYAFEGNLNDLETKSKVKALTTALTARDQDLVG